MPKWQTEQMSNWNEIAKSISQMGRSSVRAALKHLILMNSTITSEHSLQKRLTCAKVANVFLIRLTLLLFMIFKTGRKIGQKCSQCDFSSAFPFLLDWAHIHRDSKLKIKNGKTMSPAQIRVKAKFLAEIKKCRLLCCHCHAYETAQENKEMRQSDSEMSRPSLLERNKVDALRNMVNADKQKRGFCKDCKMQVSVPFYFLFQYDHRPEHIKIDSVAVLVNTRQKEEVIRQEMEKCDLRCIMCHKIITELRAGRIKETAPILNSNFIQMMKTMQVK
jgi:hypothetical protein